MNLFFFILNGKSHRQRYKPAGRGDELFTCVMRDLASTLFPPFIIMLMNLLQAEKQNA